VFSRIDDGGDLIVEDGVPFSSLIARRPVLVPGERYPDRVRAVTLPGQSGQCEPCCGTHLVRLGDVQAFCVVDVKSMGYGVRSFKCLAGERAQAARQRGMKLIREVQQTADTVDALTDKSNPEEVTELSRKVSKWRQLLSQQGRSEDYSAKAVPWVVVEELGAFLTDLYRSLLSRRRGSSKSSMVHEMEVAVEDAHGEDCVTHMFDTGDSAKVSLSRVAKVCADKPCLVLSAGDAGVFGRASVPEGFPLDATEWLQAVAEPFEAEAAPPRGQNGRLVSNFHVKRNAEKVALARKRGMTLLEEAQNFARERLPASTRVDK